MPPLIQNGFQFLFHLLHGRDREGEVSLQEEDSLPKKQLKILKNLYKTVDNAKR